MWSTLAAAFALILSVSLKVCKIFTFHSRKRTFMLKKTWYSSITFIIHEHTGLQGCDLESVDMVYRWFSCKQHLCAWYLPNKFLWDSTKNEHPWRQWWRCKLQILGKHNCGGDLSVIFRAWPPVHNNSIFTATFSKKLTIASSSLMTLVTLLIKKSSTL